MSQDAPRVLAGKYRLLSKLHAGGMGEVWAAEHLGLRSRVAVKLIAKHAISKSGVRRFVREARAAASIGGANVVRVHDCGVDGDTPFIVMELLEGETLDTRLQRVKKLPWSQTARVFRQMSRAVERAHASGIVHRDLKPANVFLALEEGRELVKLLDFGVAKAEQAWINASIAGAETQAGTFVGTPYYVSPEQAVGQQDVDARTDIWSLGVIAYECLLGELPFYADTFGSLVVAVCTGPVPVPSQSGEVPEGFDAWFARACARDRGARFPSAREAGESLGDLLDAALPAQRSARRATSEEPRRHPPGAFRVPGASGTEGAEGLADATPATGPDTWSGAAASGPVRPADAGSSARVGGIWVLAAALLVAGAAAVLPWLPLVSAPEPAAAAMREGGVPSVAELAPAAPGDPFGDFSVVTVSELALRPPSHGGVGPLAAWGTDAGPSKALDASAPARDAGAPADAGGLLAAQDGGRRPGDAEGAEGAPSLLAPAAPGAIDAGAKAAGGPVALAQSGAAGGEPGGAGGPAAGVGSAPRGADRRAGPAPAPRRARAARPGGAPA